MFMWSLEFFKHYATRWVLIIVLSPFDLMDICCLFFNVKWKVVSLKIKPLWHLSLKVSLLQLYVRQLFQHKTEQCFVKLNSFVFFYELMMVARHVVVWLNWGFHALKCFHFYSCFFRMHYSDDHASTRSIIANIVIIFCCWIIRFFCCWFFNILETSGNVLP